MTDPLYLDAAATSPVRRAVLEAMWPYLTAEFGNPSSVHALGERAMAAVDESRAVVAEWLGCRASEVIVTSGGTEADNLAITGIALATPRGRHIVTSTIEHEAVLESCNYLERFHGFSVTRVPVDTTGLLDLDAFVAALRPDTTLVSVMLANNEIGTVQPLAEVARLAAAHAIPVHTDAVQAAAWLPLRELVRGEAGGAAAVDALSISGHKLGAPKGIGALFVRGRVPLEPLIHGGGHERGRRSGTENVASIVGLAAGIRAVEAEQTASRARSIEARDAFIHLVEAGPGNARLTGHRGRRLPGHASFTFPGLNGESLLIELESRGVLASSGSACAAGRSEPSHVLLALGLDAAEAQTAVRFTFDASVSEADLARAATALGESVLAVQGLGRG